MKTEEEQSEWVQEMLGILTRGWSDPENITLVKWEGCPGALRVATREAFAIVRTNGDWVSVSFSDMFHTGCLIGFGAYAQLWPDADLSLVPWRAIGHA